MPYIRSLASHAFTRKVCGQTPLGLLQFKSKYGLTFLSAFSVQVAIEEEKKAVLNEDRKVHGIVTAPEKLIDNQREEFMTNPPR